MEYFFGQGIQRKVPGSTHHGQPIEVLPLGITELPEDVIAEYIDSLASIYTAESYDLFTHNCNNFTQDLSVFLVGKDIPERIRSLPQRFLDTPIGQMLRTQIDQSMRSMTQAPDADLPGRGPQTLTSAQRAPSPPRNDVVPHGKVRNVRSGRELESLLQSATKSCAVVFFTSATCPPCKLVYPAYDELAAEAGGRAVLIKVDLSQVDVRPNFSVRVTPTFMTFLKGEKENEWSGADESQLRGNVRLLIQMAWPTHSHRSLRLSSFERKLTEPVLYKKVPPIEKLLAKLGSMAQEPAVSAVATYIQHREASGKLDAPLPNLQAFGDFICSNFSQLPRESHFAAIDLVRLAALDIRASGWLATEKDHRTLVTLVPDSDLASGPYNIQVVTMQLLCNLFTTPLIVDQLAVGASGNLRSMFETAAASSLLATKSNTRHLASALVYNMALFDHNQRLEGLSEKVCLSQMEALQAALIEAVINENESLEALHGLLLALGAILYCADASDSFWDLCSAMEVKEALEEKAKTDSFKGEALLREVGDLLDQGRPA